MTSAVVDILAGIGAAFAASMIAVTAWVTVCAVVRRKAPAPARPPVPGTAPVPGITGPPPTRPRHTPQRPSPAPGHCWLCGYYPWQRGDGTRVMRYERCPAHTQRETGCACGGTGWATITAADGTLTQRACRDCLGPGDRS